MDVCLSLTGRSWRFSRPLTSPSAPSQQRCWLGVTLRPSVTMWPNVMRAATRWKRLRRRRVVDPFLAKIKELVERSNGKVRADVVHRRIVAMGFFLVTSVRLGERSPRSRSIGPRITVAVTGPGCLTGNVVAVQLGRRSAVRPPVLDDGNKIVDVADRLGVG